MAQLSLQPCPAGYGDAWPLTLAGPKPCGPMVSHLCQYWGRLATGASWDSRTKLPGTPSSSQLPAIPVSLAFKAKGATLFTIAKIQKQPKRPSTDKWINKMWYTHTNRPPTHTQWNTAEPLERMKIATTWMNVEGMILSEISQTDKYCILSLTCGIQKIKQKKSESVSRSVISDSLQPHGL